MLKSDVYHPLHVYHVYSELRIKFRHQSIWHLTPALHFVFFIFIFCLFIYFWKIFVPFCDAVSTADDICVWMIYEYDNV